jgi:predicted ATPase
VILIILGYPSAALTGTVEFLSAARRRSEPHSIVNALLGDGMLRLMLRDTRLVAERADELLSLATEHEMVVPSVMATFYHGWAMAAAGSSEEGIAKMRRSVSDPRIAETAMSALLFTTLAEICGKNTRVEEGLDLVARELETGELTAMSWLEAELRRVKGELLLVRQPPDELEAEHYFRTAIDVARRQSARFFELRATLSLARLLASRGHRGEARAMLADIYNWFTEGFDTADLKDAKALLDELGA